MYVIKPNALPLYVCDVCGHELPSHRGKMPKRCGNRKCQSPAWNRNGARANKDAERVGNVPIDPERIGKKTLQLLALPKGVTRGMPKTPKHPNHYCKAHHVIGCLSCE